MDEMIVGSIFGETMGGEEAEGTVAAGPRGRTAIETALLEEFAEALGDGFAAAFAAIGPIDAAFKGLVVLSDPFALGKRDGEAAAARFSLRMSAGACECLILIPQALLMPFRKELAHDPGADAPGQDRRWSRSMEAGVQQTRLPVAAVLEEVPMLLGDIANLRVGGVLPLRSSDFSAIRLECSGRHVPVQAWPRRRPLPSGN